MPASVAWRRSFPHKAVYPQPFSRSVHRAVFQREAESDRFIVWIAIDVPAWEKQKKPFIFIRIGTDSRPSHIGGGGKERNHRRPSGNPLPTSGTPDIPGTPAPGGQKKPAATRTAGLCRMRPGCYDGQILNCSTVARSSSASLARSALEAAQRRASLSVCSLISATVATLAVTRWVTSD